MSCSWFSCGSGLIQVWFRFGSALVQRCVVCGYLVQPRFSVSSASCGMMLYMVQLWVRFGSAGSVGGAVVCGMVFCGSGVVHLCCGLVWQVVMWFGVGSALVQHWFSFVWPIVL